jgi:signal peptidase II
LLFFIISGPIILVDQFIKSLLYKQIININYLCNKGIAFGVLINTTIQLLINTILLALLLYLILFKKTKQIYSLIPFLFILGGGVSNIIDRLYYKCVIDYFYLPFIPVFNIADFFISFGIIVYIFQKKKLRLI